MKRNPRLLNRTDKRQEEEKIKQEGKSNRTQIIAVASAYAGAGCTHHALNLAYTLSKTHRTALVELDKKAELKGFEEEYNLERGALDSKKLEKLEVHFYTEQIDLMKIIRQKYEFIVLDVGELYLKIDTEYKKTSYYTEVCRADTRILISQVKEWKNLYLERFIKEEVIEEWVIACNLTEAKEYKKLKREIESINKEIKVVQLESCDVFNGSSKLAEIL